MKPNYDYRKDFLDRTVLVGDPVIVNEPKYHNLVCGRIIKFTPKGVKVKFINSKGHEVESFYFDGQFIFLEGKYREQYEERGD